MARGRRYRGRLPVPPVEVPLVATFERFGVLGGRLDGYERGPCEAARHRHAFLVQSLHSVRLQKKRKTVVVVVVTDQLPPSPTLHELRVADSPFRVRGQPQFRPQKTEAHCCRFGFHELFLAVCLPAL